MRLSEIRQRAIFKEFLTWYCTLADLFSISGLNLRLVRVRVSDSKIQASQFALDSEFT